MIETNDGDINKLFDHIEKIYSQIIHKDCFVVEKSRILEK